MIPSFQWSASRRVMLLGGLLGLLSRPAFSATIRVEVWKEASCGCCSGWVRHLQKAGIQVVAHDVADMSAVKQANGVPPDLWSCHTAIVDGYVIEGHVPADDIQRLLRERPTARGLSAPGMPASAPGMDIPGEPYDVVLFGGPSGTSIFARH